MKGILRWSKGPVPKMGWYVTFTDTMAFEPTRRTFWWPVATSGQGLFQDGTDLESGHGLGELSEWRGKAHNGLPVIAHTRRNEQAAHIDNEPIPPPPATAESKRLWDDGRWKKLVRGKWQPVPLPPVHEPWRRYTVMDPRTKEPVFGLAEVEADNGILPRLVAREKGKAWQTLDRGEACLVDAMGRDRNDGGQETYIVRRDW